MSRLRRLVERLPPGLRSPLRRIRDLGRWATYLPNLLVGRPAGHFSYRFADDAPDFGPVEILMPLGVDAHEALSWCGKQTLPDWIIRSAEGWEMRSHGLSDDAEPTWFYAPGSRLHDLPAFLESARFVAAAERIDAVVLSDAGKGPASAAEAVLHIHRVDALFRCDAYDYDAQSDIVVPRPGRRLIKAIDGPLEPPRTRAAFGRSRRGPYLSSEPLPPILEIELRDVARAAIPRPPDDASAENKPTVLVSQSFLAHGGAEHTLFEALSHLQDDFHFVLATFAPHAPERGDRRPEFRRVSEHLYSLGDLVHPAAMEGILVALIEQTGAKTLFNNNGTTLFYDLAPRLKARCPDLRIVDHLYDHRIGYVTWYDDRVRDAVDVCVAENRPIRKELIEHRGWTAERVPVIWPCGRRLEEFPSIDERPALRRALRAEFDLQEHDVVFLTAARMNFQKRPLDLVRLAERVRDLPNVAFLVVGGGELEDEVDRAVAAARAEGARIRREPFRNDIPALLTACDVGCLVSEFEGLPVFMMESFQAGLPFLGTDVGDLGAVLRETGAGIVVEEPGDLDALEAAVRELADPKRRAVYAARAPEAAELFDPKVCARRYGEVLSS